MKTTLIAAVIALMSATTSVSANPLSVNAGWTGSHVGNFSYWNNSGTGQSITCQRIGGFTYC